MIRPIMSLPIPMRPVSRGSRSAPVIVAEAKCGHLRARCPIIGGHETEPGADTHDAYGKPATTPGPARSSARSRRGTARCRISPSRPDALGRVRRRAEAAGGRAGGHQRRRAGTGRLHHLCEGSTDRVRRRKPALAQSGRRGIPGMDGDGPAVRASVSKAAGLHRARRLEGLARGRARYSEPQGRRGRRRTGRRGFHDLTVPRPDRSIPPEPVLSRRRDVPLHAGRRDETRVSGHRAGRLHPPGRLSRPRPRSAHPVRAPDPGGVPEGGGDARGGSQLRRRGHRTRADAHAHLLGEHRRSPPSRRAAPGHRGRRHQGTAGRARGGRRQSPSRARVEGVERKSRCLPARSSLPA